MTDILPEIDDASKNNPESTLLDAYKYWGKKRLLFNLIVGVTGVVAIFLYARTFSLLEFVDILIWGIVANGLFSFGYAFESYVIVKHPKANFKNIRFLLFYIGTFLYCLVTFILAQEYFTKPFLFD
jgi:hypothetical protein